MQKKEIKRNLGIVSAYASDKEELQNELDKIKRNHEHVNEGDEVILDVTPDLKTVQFKLYEPTQFFIGISIRRRIE